jgi:hypothetical protein
MCANPPSLFRAFSGAILQAYAIAKSWEQGEAPLARPLVSLVFSALNAGFVSASITYGTFPSLPPFRDPNQPR